jgi:hypothetical protein
MSTADGRPVSFLANWGGCPVPVIGDIDGDGDVDGADHAAFFDCLAGPDVPPAGTCPVGVDADLDFDSDVDLRDFSFLQMHSTGP